MSGVTLHPKYGLNPTLAICFWCGEDTGDIVLLGAAAKRVTGSDEAPHRTCMGLEPCDKCKANMAKGITLIEASESPTRECNTKMNDRAYVSGRWCVITEDAARRMLRGPMLDSVLKARKAFVDPRAWDEIGLPRDNNKAAA